MKIFLKVISVIFFIIAGIYGVFLYIMSFAIWHDLIGFVGYILAAIFAPDLILIVIRIIQNGFGDWYFINSIIATVSWWVGVSLWHYTHKEIESAES